MLGEGDGPVDVQITFSQVGTLSELLIRTSTQFQVFGLVLTGKTDGLFDQVMGTGLVYRKEGTLIGERKAD